MIPNNDENIIKLEKKVEKLILEKGDYNAALQLYAASARKNTDQPYYKQQYSILRRVIKMKKLLDAEDHDALVEPLKKNWIRYYLAVCGYYYSKGFYKESVTLDKKACGVLKSDQAKINYFETLVTVNDMKEAKRFSSQVSGPLKDTADFKTLDLLVKTQSGEIENPGKILKGIKVDPKTDSRSYIYFACIYQMAKDHIKACESIVTALEDTPPSSIPAARKLINNMSQFKECSDSKQFQLAVKTKSKIFQSSCTGGSSCNSCSLRRKCPSKK